MCNQIVERVKNWSHAAFVLHNSMGYPRFYAEERQEAITERETVSLQIEGICFILRFQFVLGYVTLDICEGVSYTAR